LTYGYSCVTGLGGIPGTMPAAGRSFAGFTSRGAVGVEPGAVVVSSSSGRPAQIRLT
jgi:hypothetical protein